MPALFSRSLRAKHSPVSAITRFRVSQGKREKQIDHLAVEEPLEIVLDFPTPEKPKQEQQSQRERLTLAVTMRTPGNDKELAAGFLFAEGIIKSKNDIRDIDADADSANPHNTLVVTLANQLSIEPELLQRYFFTNSSCGVCGKTSIQALEMMHQPELEKNSPKITATLLQQLPEQLSNQQKQFATTGSVHSAALFSSAGELLLLREDVGRHNAMDKLIGALLLDNKLNIARDGIVLVSGRASFELVQKALMADIPMLAAIGAPTSLAQQLADRHGMTLVGFLKPDGFNVYSAIERLI